MMADNGWTPSINSRCFVFHGPVLYEAMVKYIHRGNSETVETKDGEASVMMLVEEKTICEVPEKLQAIDTYYVHYKGWPKSWDEWVNPIRILPYNLESIRKSKELKKAALDSAAASFGPEARRIEIAVQEERQNLLSEMNLVDPLLIKLESPAIDIDQLDEEPKAMFLKYQKDNEESFIRVQKFLIRAPFSVDMSKFLRRKMVDDCENIKIHKKLTRLPAKTSVSKILAQYKEYYVAVLEASSSESLSGSETPKRKRSSPMDDSSLSPSKSDLSLYGEFLYEFLESLTVFFNRSLQKVLLYDFEQQQARVYLSSQENFDYTAQAPRKASFVYGVDHLVRLLAILPGIICQYDIDNQARDIAQYFIQHLLAYIHYHREEYYADSDNRYYRPTEKYRELAAKSM